MYTATFSLFFVFLISCKLCPLPSSLYMKHVHFILFSLLFFLLSCKPCPLHSLLFFVFLLPLKPCQLQSFLSSFLCFPSLLWTMSTSSFLLSFFLTFSFTQIFSFYRSPTLSFLLS